MSLQPIAYVFRPTNTLGCTSCAERFAIRAKYDAELIGEVYRHDLDKGDTCPCDVCGSPCAPENVEPEEAE